jgi:GNAT superfamily N-acetyltransferase
MPEAVIIRSATAADIEGLIDLLEDLFSIEEDFDVNRDSHRRGLEMMLNTGRGCILAAQAADGTVVGMCSGQLTISTAEGGPAVLIEDVVVREDRRGQGIGARLLEDLARWAADNEAGRLQLLADSGNGPALGFYEHLGFERTRLICLRNRL